MLKWCPYLKPLVYILLVNTVNFEWCVSVVLNKDLRVYPKTSQVMIGTMVNFIWTYSRKLLHAHNLQPSHRLIVFHTLRGIVE